MAIWSTRSSKKRSKVKSGLSQGVVRSSVNPYHSVEVKMSYDACDEVMELHGKRFLSAEAPVLPVIGCDRNCKCKFKHYEDRRLDDRRDAFNSSGIHFSGERNRRLGGDRRRSLPSHVSVG